jgi:D-glycero-D-manno-heptose 1,7-bisphosphate phosphatase
VNSNASGKVVILDRDGTIVVDRGYLADPAGLEFLPGAAEGLRLLHQRGCRLVVITNQSGVGRGLFSLGRLQEMNSRLEDMVRLRDARIERIYYCPHRPEENCPCRKPQTKLLMDAARELGFEPAKAVVIGDKSADIEFGRRAGASTMLISSDGLSSDGKRTAADYVVPDLLAAAAVVDTLAVAASSADR